MTVSEVFGFYIVYMFYCLLLMLMLKFYCAVPILYVLNVEPLCIYSTGIGGQTALKLIRQHGSIESILENINKER